jgi:hypothetical protein
MAADEVASFHERLIAPMRELWGGQDLGVFYFAWVVPGMLLVLVLGLCYLRFLANLPAKTRFAFLAAAALFLGGAIGMELVGGWYAESHGLNTLTYATITTVEEGLEMAGAIVFIRALLVYLADTYAEVRFRFVREVGASRLAPRAPGLREAWGRSLSTAAVSEVAA